MGSANFLQPHAFLPVEFEGNDRIRCGTGILTPINLTPWLERDPFHKEGDFDTTNLLDPSKEQLQNDLLLSDKQNSFSPSTPTNNLPTNHLTFSNTARPTAVSNNLDFSDILITARPTTTTPKTTKRPTIITIIDNKIEFLPSTTKTSTTTRPKKTKRTTKTTTTKRPNTTFIDNKIDFILMTVTKITTTKRPTFVDSPFSKTTDSKNKTIVKRSTRRNRPNDKAEHRSELIDLTDTKTLHDNLTDARKKQFRNEDNATKYLDNKAIIKTSTRSDKNETLTHDEIESRIDHKFYGNNKPKYEFDYGGAPQRPNNNFYLNYPPHSPPFTLQQQLYPTTKRPILFENNRPNYDSRPGPSQPPSSAISSPISNKLTSPFSYDTYNGNKDSVAPQISYDNMAIPLYNSPNRGGNKNNNNNNRPIFQNYYRPTYATTRKHDLSTFLIIETTRRTTPAPQFFFDLRTSRRPPQSPIFHTNKDVFLSLSPHTSSNSYSNSNFPSDYDSDAINKFSHFISNTKNHKFSTKRPPPFYEIGIKPAHYTDETAVDNDSFDGYLRPENNFYIPLVNGAHKFSYNDYTKYNDKAESSTVHSVKYYFKQNILHKYHTIKSSEPKVEDEGEEDLYGKRYAEVYDKHLTDADTTTDDFVTLAKTTKEPTDTDTETVTFTESSETKDIKRTLKIDGRSKHMSGNKNHNPLFANTLFVPFKVLTSETRPDNWVNVNIQEDEKFKTKLPEVPILKQDGNFVRELPKPLKA